MFIRPVPAGIPIMTLKTACATIKGFQDRGVTRMIKGFEAPNQNHE